MPEFIRIGDRYINLDQIAGVDFGKHSRKFDRDSEEIVPAPMVVITLITRSVEGLSDTLIYEREQADAVWPWLKNVLDARTAHAIDLPPSSR